MFEKLLEQEYEKYRLEMEGLIRCCAGCRKKVGENGCQSLGCDGTAVHGTVDLIGPICQVCKDLGCDSCKVTRNTDVV